ncbi:MAG: hypothetical protein ACKV2Q_03895 [Planctomycetaceae bacterium]
MTLALGLWLIRVTIWVAVAGWLLRVFVEAAGRSFATRDRVVRWSWLIGALACVAHAIVAMGFGHCWSLANAMRFTAMETRRVFHVELPWSVFVNFAFVAWWLIDGVREFRSQEVRALGAMRHGVWLMMMLNGTVVFGPRYWIWIAVPVAMALALVRWNRSGSKKFTASEW